MIGLGIAGNFTGHLEQAKEASSFVNVKVEEHHAPKGLFPFYVPSKTDSFIEVYPLSSTEVSRPEEGGNLQIEPEVAIVCFIDYEDGRVVRITPIKFGAFNDCSIRKEGAKKISEKKNWGANSKGISEQLIDVDNFQEGGVMDFYRIACYLLRDGYLHAYGVDSAVRGYSYFYKKLLDWIVEKANTQEDGGPLESIQTLLKQSNYPKQAIISIGATLYTEFGEKAFLKANDELFVVVYHSEMYNLSKIENFIKIKEGN